MQIIEHTLIGLAIMAGIAWPAVFIVVFIDKLRGTGMSFFGGGRYHLPKLPPLSWPKRLILLPLFIPIFILILWLLLPPLFILRLLERLRARISGGNAKRKGHET